MYFDTEKKTRYTKQRQSHWDGVSLQKTKRNKRHNHYQSLLHNHYRFLIPPNSKILEIGTGHGHLLSALHPSEGVGLDFSPEMIKQAEINYPGLDFYCLDAHEFDLTGTFDAVILSDLLNDLWDTQWVLKTIRKNCDNNTRILINSYSRLWQPILKLAANLNLATPNLQQNWFTREDIINLLTVEGYEVIRSSCKILLPINIPILTGFFNKLLANFSPFNGFNLTHFIVARKIPEVEQNLNNSGVSVIVAACNEAGNIHDLLKRIPQMGKATEIIFIEGGSSDNTYSVIEEALQLNPDLDIKLFKQRGKGKGDAVRLGFERASYEILMILDADMTVSPEDLPRFHEALISGKGEFINGVRLVYPMEKKAMRFLNLIGNKSFSMIFSWILGQSIKDTLCGTKVLTKSNYQKIANNRSYFGDFDPFGDFDLIFGAAKQNLKMVDMPIRYGERTYGDTNIKRWTHGLLLLKMSVFALRKMKFL